MAIRKITQQSALTEEEMKVFATHIDEGDDDGFDAEVHNYSIEDATDVYLARLILAQAAQDALRGESFVRTCARAYLTNYSEGLEIVCEAAQIDLDYLVERWTKRVGWTAFPVNYETLYRRDLKWKKRPVEVSTSAKRVPVNEIEPAAAMTSVIAASASTSIAVTAPV